MQVNSPPISLADSLASTWDCTVRMKFIVLQVLCITLAACAEDGYKRFLDRHVITEPFDRNNAEKWEEYLTEKKLCGRVLIQSFMEDERLVEDICNCSGRRLMIPQNPLNNENYCISENKIDVFDVQSHNTTRGCQVEHVTKRYGYVIVACDKIRNRCLPVHYEQYQNEEPNMNADHCQKICSPNLH
ncbi:hypothetical protein GN956_G20692 [Arapaima gigas]